MDSFLFRRIFTCLVVVLFLGGFAHAVSDDEKAQGALRIAASRLGWPEAVTQGEKDQESVGHQFYITSDGKGEDSDIKASIVVLPTDLMSGYWLSFLSEQVDMERTTYQGRDAAISHYGKNCNPKPLVKTLNLIFTGWFESIFGVSEDPDKGCVTDHGAIAFSCGKYLMIATDDRDEVGMEEDVAAELYSAVTEAGLCSYGDTLVILAGTTDKPGVTKLAEYEKIAQGVNTYYGVNTYGKKSFTYTFRDADGSKGKNDWYDVAPTQTGFGNKGYFEAAVKKAFAGGDVPQDLRFDRIVIVYSGKSKQTDPTAVLSTADGWAEDDYCVEVDAASRKAKICTPNRILVSEEDTVGDWSHEIGHSLWWKYKTDGKYYRINDRYNYPNANWKYGYVGPWDLMGDGNYWGNPKGSTPTHMSSYTKEAAGWLSYTTMNRNKTYTDKGLEDKSAGDLVLQFDDPTSNDALFFYVVEARDSGWTYGAPQNGVVLYKVSYDHGNTHEIVNVIWPQNGTKTGETNGRQYVYPTLNGLTAVNGSTKYINVPGKFMLTLERETASPYSASIRLDDYTPVNVVGAVVAPNGSAIPAGVPGGVAAGGGIDVDPPGPKPDLDLHAYDGAGGHVGLNYQTGIYENTILGAIGSGDLQDDSEWIFVPEGTDVRYEVSNYKTQQYVARNPEYAGVIVPMTFSPTYVKFDSNGNRHEAGGVPGTAGTGAMVPIQSPNDPSLKYVPKESPGFGNNSICPWFPALVLLLLAGAVKRK